MKIVKERTRLIFTEFTEAEKKHLENIVASMDNVFMYIDPDGEKLGLPTGMEDRVKRIFPKAEFIDKSNEYWPYATISPVTHDAKPRNQLQVDFINFVGEKVKNKQKLAGILGVGTGKLHPNYTKLPAPNDQGFILLGDLNVGDKIFGSDGSQVTVTNIYEHPNEDIYKITFNDGRYSLCGADHLWPVMKTWTSKITVMSTKDIMNSNYKYYDPYKSKIYGEDTWKYNYRIPLLSSPVEYDHKDVPIHPYIIGAFIGNGCCTLPALSLSSGDDFVPNKIAHIIGSTTRKRKGAYTYTFYDDSHVIKTAEFFKDIPEMIGKYAHEKSIPEIYMYNSLEIRMELLRGLMDTDGSITYAEGRFNVSYSSCSKKLLEQIRELILGLGFICNISSPDKRTEKYRFGYHSQVNIRVPNSFKQELFTHPAKYKTALAASLRGDYRQPFTHLIIKNVEKVSKADSRCITVDAPDHLYLTEDFIVTHNTFMACYSAIAAGLRTLIIAPTSSIKKQWADTLTGMFKVDPSRVLLVNDPKQFINVKADFVIISQASLAILNKSYDLEKIMKDNKFGIKVIDEVQMWFKNIINVDANCNIANNWYLTGTFGRSGDKENKLFQEMFGDLAIFVEKEKKPTIFNQKPGNIYGMKPHVNTKMIWSSSGLSDEEIKKVTSSMRYSEREGKWMRMGINVPAYTNLIIPEDGTITPFMKVIFNTIKMANREVKYGSMLILCSTIASSEIIADHCRKIFPDKKVGVINSEYKMQENENTKKTCDIVVSTVASAGTGFDMKGLAKLILVQPMKSWVLTTQVVGRLRRRDDGRETYFYDIVDSDIRQLRAWANARADVERRMSKTFKVVDM